MKKLINLVACYLLLATLAGCSCSHSVDPSGSGKIVGTVTDDSTKKPIEDASVTYSNNSITATTKTDGRYEITIPTGTQKLSFSKDGYTSKTAEINIVGEASVTLNVALVPKGANTNVAKLEISPTSVTLKIGETKKFEIKAYDSAGNAVTNFTAETSINPANLGTIDQAGTFTAKEEGTGTLTVKVGTASATASIVVLGNYPSGPPHLVKSWGALVGSGSLAIYKDTIYVDTERSKIVMYDLEGNLKGTFGSKGSEPGQINSVRGIDAGPFGLFIGDLNNYRVQRFDLSGNFQFEFGTESQNFETGKFSYLVDLAVDVLGNIYTLEGSGGTNEPQRVQTWDQKGNWISAWGKYGRTGQAEFYNPSGICIDGSGNIFVADSENRRIQKFDAEGKFLKMWPTPERTGGITWSKSDNICYANISGGTVGAYTSQGRLLYSWKHDTTAYGIDCDDSGNVYTVEYDTGRILKFGY